MSESEPNFFLKSIAAEYTKDASFIHINDKKNSNSLGLNFGKRIYFLVNETGKWVEFKGEKDYKTIRKFVEEFLRKMHNIKYNIGEKEAIAKGANIIVIYKPTDKLSKDFIVDRWVESRKNDILSLVQNDSRSEILLVENQKIMKKYPLSKETIESLHGLSHSEDL